MGGTSNAVKPHQANQLAIVPVGAKINFYINGNQVAAIKNESATSGGAGLVAISSGMFLFDNFTIYNSPEPKALPSVSHKVERATNAGKSVRASKAQRKMLRSFKKVLKIGMTKQQVIQMFGRGWERGARLFYDLGSRSLGPDVDILTIEFDSEDKVVRFRDTRG